MVSCIVINAADLTESVGTICERFYALGQQVTVTLLKLRLGSALKQALENSTIIRDPGTLPAELKRE